MNICKTLMSKMIGQQVKYGFSKARGRPPMTWGEFMKKHGPTIQWIMMNARRSLIFRTAAFKALSNKDPSSTVNCQANPRRRIQLDQTFNSLMKIEKRLLNLYMRLYLLSGKQTLFARAMYEQLKLIKAKPKKRRNNKKKTN